MQPCRIARQAGSQYSVCGLAASPLSGSQQPIQSSCSNPPKPTHLPHWLCCAQHAFCDTSLCVVDSRGLQRVVCVVEQGHQIALGSNTCCSADQARIRRF